MPWETSNVMEKRYEFIRQFRDEECSLAELCREHGISRKTGYKWLERFDECGMGGLGDRSSSPLHSPNQVSPEVEAEILRLRGQHPTWGPKKLLKSLSCHGPEKQWPARSTIGALLQRKGLTHPQKNKARVRPSEEPLKHADAPNRVWCMDFKGWFRCGDKSCCYPLTITDAYSRYLLRCQGLKHGEEPSVRPVIEAAFREYGLPEAIRTDNGPPFASVGLAGLSQLSVWWIRLGIRVERIKPGKPQQNGRHERMHRTLKQESIHPPAATQRAQQRAFDRFRREYNEERPHEALRGDTPSDHFRPSGRAYPRKLAEIEYPSRFQVRFADERGTIRFQSARCFLAHTLKQQYVGLEPVGDGLWCVWFSKVLLGVVDERNVKVHNPADRRLNRFRLQSPYGFLPPESIPAQNGHVEIEEEENTEL